MTVSRTIFNIVVGDGSKRNKVMATLIKHSGERIKVFPASKGLLTLREIQDMIGGEVEELPLAMDNMMMIRRNCEIWRLQVNLEACNIAFLNDIFRCITGDVLICEVIEVEE